MDAQQKDRTPGVAPLGLGAVTTDHPLIAIPFTAEIDGRQYKGAGLSLVRAEAFGLMDPALDGATRLVRLSFVFQGFTVVLGVECTLNPTEHTHGKVILIFSDPTGAHLPQLRHVLNSYVAGDLVTMGQFLATTSVKPAALARPGQAAASGGFLTRALRKTVGTLTLAVLTVALFAAVGTLGYNRLFVTPILTPAQIMPEGQTLTAVAAGQLDYVNMDATRGEVAFVIRSVSGQVLSMAMPCDCTGMLTGVKAGDTLATGDSVMLVHAKDAPLVLRTVVPGIDLFKLTAADHLKVTLADGSEITAHLADKANIRQATGVDDEVAVVLVPDQPLGAEHLGQLARVSIIRPLPSLLSPLADLQRAVGL